MSWVKYNVNHNLEWLLDTIESIKNLSQEDLDKEEDKLSMQSMWLSGRIGAFESIEKIIKEGMMP